MKIIKGGARIIGTAVGTIVAFAAVVVAGLWFTLTVAGWVAPWL